ncbi:hypothetical protein AB0G04_33625 [Actinoplanes sp. NPDC023801]|uniref:hypothetical protein n=1 Tax=Actinoplanes sp. NPDC023801 TaxID=3154595 RepID=UPI0033F014EF
MPFSRAGLLAVLLLAGLTGCTGDDRPAAPAASAPAASLPAAPGPTENATTPAAAPFPFTVNRRGGFAGVDDRARIDADGTVVVTTRERSSAPASLPAATMDELRRLLTSADFTGRAGTASAPTCDDGFEYELATPEATVTVHDCGDPHGATVDRLVAISAGLFNG